MFDCHFASELDNRASRHERDAYVDWMRSEAEAMGVDRLCLITRKPTRGETVEETREDNELLAKLIDENPDLLHAWAYVHPFQGEAAVEEFRRAITEDGLLGLKWGPLADCSKPVADPFAEAAIEMDVPIKLHSAHRTAGKRDDIPEESFTDDVAALAERYPDLKILESHIPCPGDWEYRIKKIAPYENVYLDLSGTNCEQGIIEMAAEYVGVDRLVYGSDNIHIPCVGKLEGANLTAEEKATVAYNMNDLLASDDPRRYSEAELAQKRAEAIERFESVGQERTETIVDANGFVGEWPFRDLDASVEALLEILDEAGVSQAVASSLEAVTYRNPQPGNRSFAAEIDDHRDRIIPFATINPTYAGWEDDLEECLDELDMQGVKLLPAYHDYDIGDEAVTELLNACAERDVPVMFCAALEDQRGSHPRFELKGFEHDDRRGGYRDYFRDDHVGQLIDQLQACPETDIILADAWSRVYRIVDAIRAPGDAIWEGTWERSGKTLFVLDDLPMFYVARGERIVSEIGVDNLVMGPQLPFKIFESYYGMLEQLPISEREKDQIRSENLLELIE